MDDDEFESPFSHVPVSGAGPVPMQDGPFTYEKMVASTGASGRASETPRWVVRVLCVLGALVVAGVIALWIGAFLTN